MMGQRVSTRQWRDDSHSPPRIPCGVNGDRVGEAIGQRRAKATEGVGALR